MYPSAPLLLRLWTAPAFPACRVATETPADLQSVLESLDAVVRVQRYGGPRSVTLDRPLLDVDVFALNLDSADRICNEVASAWEWSMPGALIDAGADGRAVVAKVTISSGPSQRPTADPGLARVGFSAQVVLHAR
jgi:hypothetical protein